MYNQSTLTLRLYTYCDDHFTFAMLVYATISEHHRGASQPLFRISRPYAELLALIVRFLRSRRRTA